MRKVKRITEHFVIECYYNEEGKLHREDGPAKLYWHYKKDDIENCSNGILNKEEYYLNGKLFRNEGPVIIKYANRNVSYQEFLETKNGLKSITFKYQKNELMYKKETFKNDIIVITRFQSGNVSLKTYSKNSVFHRIGGPAVIRYSNGKIIEQEYYLNGIRADELQSLVLGALKDEC